MQLDLFSAVMASYVDAAMLSNDALYGELVERGVIEREALQARVPIGASGARHSPAKRQLRWLQQTMRSMGLVERMPGLRGHWKATQKAREALTPAQPKVVMLGFHTELGIAVWGDAEEVFGRLDQEVHLAITSPPYPLRAERAYGNPSAEVYTDFVCGILKPIVARLARGGAVALNLSNDIFVEGSPARHLYRERLVIALHERLGLHKMDEIIWANPSKPPGPIAWASKKRMQLNVAWEPVYWFTNDPVHCQADNRRVLQPHSTQQTKLIARGGERRDAAYADGAYRIKPGSFGAVTAGRIPRNLLSISHNCPDQKRLRAMTDAAGLPRHGAVMPLKLASMLVDFLCPPGKLVVDPCAGTFTTAMAAEKSGRPWIACDRHLEYVQAGALRLGLAQ